MLFRCGDVHMQSGIGVQPSEELRSVLRPDEKIVWYGKPTPSIAVLRSLPRSVFGLIFLFVAILVIFTGEAPALIFGSIFLTIALLMVVGGPLYAYLRMKVIEYVITNKRLITKYGIIGRDYRFTEIDKIQSVDVIVDFWDKVFNAGKVRATLMGIGGHTFSSINDPYEVQKIINDMMDQMRAPSPAAPPPSAPGAKIFCKYCGASIDADSTFCGSCGRKIK